MVIILKTDCQKFVFLYKICSSSKNVLFQTLSKEKYGLILFCVICIINYIHTII